MELDRIKFLRNQFWVYTNLGATLAVDIDSVNIFDLLIHLFFLLLINLLFIDVQTTW